MGTLGRIFKARKQILEGAFNLIHKNEFVEVTQEYRINICKSCEYYNGKCAVPGTGPCCGACGCSLAVKTRSLSTVCGIVEKGKEPKWLPVLTAKQEAELDAKEIKSLEDKAED